jgi:hypothetical protein
MGLRPARRRLAFLLIGPVMAALALGAPPAVAGARTAAPSAWQLVPAPPANGGELMDVAGSSPTDVWAVGERWTPSAALLTFAMHWDGRAWSTVRTPSISDWNMLRDVAVLSPDDAWAVGFTKNYANLIEHWNGSAWGIVPVPGLPADTPLYGVQAISADDIWAVGQKGEDGLILHYDGTSWSSVPFPEPPGSDYTFFGKVAGVASNDVWAAGTAEVGTDQLLLLHWDGTSWTAAPGPKLGDFDYIRGGSALASNDIWFVGDTEGPAPDYTEHPLAIHWDGTAWASVRSEQGTEPWGVAQRSSADAWIAGSTGSASTTYEATVEHWSGGTWRTVAVPPTGQDSELNGIASVSDGTVWAVGSYEPSGQTQPLIMRLRP